MTTPARDSFLHLIEAERARQSDLPGSEFDINNTVNDWIAIATHYLSEPAKRPASKQMGRGLRITQSEYEDSLVKAAAVILAALEHSDSLKKRDHLL